MLTLDEVSTSKKKGNVFIKLNGLNLKDVLNSETVLPIFFWFYTHTCMCACACACVCVKVTYITLLGNYFQ